ncbi:MAG: hypothetical protein HY040_20410 [Planctomycetes bacterium]|nr:hypothetical protein [Planctomycetota bacterium]
MRLILRRWRWLVLVASLMTLGWILFHLLPPEARWRIEFKQNGSALLVSKVFWNLSQNRVQVRTHMGPTMALELGRGKIVTEFSDANEVLKDFQFSADGRYSIGATGNKIRWMDFVAGEESLIEVDLNHETAGSRIAYLEDLQLSRDGAYFVAHAYRPSGKQDGVYQGEALVINTTTRDIALHEQGRLWFVGFHPLPATVIYTSTDSCTQK